MYIHLYIYTYVYTHICAYVYDMFFSTSRCGMAAALSASRAVPRQARSESLTKQQEVESLRQDGDCPRLERQGSLQAIYQLFLSSVKEPRWFHPEHLWYVEFQLSYYAAGYEYHYL